MIQANADFGRVIIQGMSRWGKGWRTSKPWTLPNIPFGFLSGSGPCGGQLTLAWVDAVGHVRIYHYGAFFCPGGADVAYGSGTYISDILSDAVQNPAAGPAVNGLTGGLLFNAVIRNTPTKLRRS